jgi:hypothetical protein
MKLLRRRARAILLLPLTAFLLAAGALGWVLWQLRPAADGWDATNAPASTVRLVFSSSPRMQAIRDSLANAYVDLEAQKKLARAVGLPLSTDDVELRHVPDTRNAALPARKLQAALQARPIPGAIKAVLDNGPASSADARVLTAFLKARPELLSMVAAVTARPDFALNRTWTIKDVENANYGPLAAMREAAGVLRARAFILGQNGRYAEALSVDRQSLRLAALASSENGILAWLIGRATEATALNGIQSTLARGGASGDVALSAVRAVRAMPPMPSVANALRFEFLDGWLRLPKDSLLTFRPGAPPVIPAPRGKNPLSKGRLEAAALAEYLREMRLTLAVAESSDAMRSAPMRKLNDTAIGRVPPTPQSLYAEVLVPRISRLLRRAAESQARRNITLGAAEILAQKARTGSFPATVPAMDRGSARHSPLTYRRTPDGFALSATIREKDFADGLGTDKADTVLRFDYPAR